MDSFDCVVVGSGHAGSCAALSAVEHGCQRVLIIDKCPEAWAGGNGYFTAGAHRTVHGGLSDLLPLVKNKPAQELLDRIDMTPYTREDFTSDILRLSDGKSDPEMVEAVVNGSRDTIEWLIKHVGIPFTFSFNRQAYEVDGKQKFWGGMVLMVEDGGKGLISAHQRALADAGVEIWYESPASSLIVNEHKVSGVVVCRGGKDIEVRAHAVVLAAGGFEANAELRRQHLGRGWELARVRGTPYNTGDGFVLAEAVGAKMAGDWAGCHSTTWDANTDANAGQRELTNQYTKSGYPLGIMVNANGLRFVDEGEDYRNYTYAKFGRAILQQPGGYAFQIYDAAVIDHLRKEEYADDVVEKIFANSLSELGDKLEAVGLVDKDQFVSSVKEFNGAVHQHRLEHDGLRWDPAVKDGLSTQSAAAQLDVPKSNWALPLEKGPFMAVKVVCGITFTFGGLSIAPESAAVTSKAGGVIEGLYCTGEMVGGLFYHNYPGGSGLTAGAVFGRKAGREAARIAARVV